MYLKVLPCMDSEWMILHNSQYRKSVEHACFIYNQKNHPVSDRMQDMILNKIGEAA